MYTRELRRSSRMFGYFYRLLMSSYGLGFHNNALVRYNVIIVNNKALCSLAFTLTV